MALNVSPEQQLLVRASAAPGRRLPDLGPIGEPSVRWDRLIELADWHGLSPLLWRYLHAHGCDTSAPARVRDQLHYAATATTARNLSLQAELDRILAALADLGISSMLLKGAALIEGVYPDIGLRPMGDLDILVPRAAIEAAHRAVEELGYAVWSGSLSRHDAWILARHHHHYPLQRGGVSVELHHHLTYACPDFDIAGVWARAVPGRGRVPHLLPGPEDLFLHGALHFSNDRLRARYGCGLGQLADLDWIAAHWCVDWDGLAARAQDYGLADRLFLALLAGDLLLGDLAPPNVLASLRPRSYRPGLGEEFVRQCVLRSHPAGLPLDRLSFGRRASQIWSGATLIRASPPIIPPVILWPRVRRALASGRRVAALAAASPRSFVADLRLAWWVRSLRL